ncbi:MAG: hypothetical protein EA402_01935 [Planctomycetota bacterium]|nr:MAG: hypothetical protein EA402_01935 [Planctomycetota bacterium]
MDDAITVSPSNAVALFACHLATAIREASSAMRQQRVLSTRYAKARSITERISGGAQSQPPEVNQGNDRQQDGILADIQALSDAMRHLPWLTSADAEQRRQGIDFHRRVIEVLAARFGEQRALLYKFDAPYLARCLQAMEDS